MELGHPSITLEVSFVCNFVEPFGGSVRTHQQESQGKRATWASSLEELQNFSISNICKAGKESLD